MVRKICSRAAERQPGLNSPSAAQALLTAYDGQPYRGRYKGPARTRCRVRLCFRILSTKSSTSFF